MVAIEIIKWVSKGHILFRILEKCHLTFFNKHKMMLYFLCGYLHKRKIQLCISVNSNTFAHTTIVNFKTIKRCYAFLGKNTKASGKFAARFQLFDKNCCATSEAARLVVVVS